MELNNLSFRFFRNSIAGVLTALNNIAHVVQVEDGKIKEYPLPVYYDFANDGQFMRDFFYEMPNWCNVPEHSEGMFEKQPYGAITFDEFTVVQQEITNRYVRGNFDRLIVDEESGEQAIMAYSAYMFSLPLRLTFSGIIKVDNLLQGFSVLESLLDYFYKNNINYFHYKSLRIPLLITFGDKGSITKKVPITYKDPQQKEVPFTIEVETFFPVFDKEEESSLRFRGNKIRDFYEKVKDHQSNDVLIESRVPKTNIGQYHGTNDPTDGFTFILSDFEGNVSDEIQYAINTNNGNCYTIAVGNFRKDHNITNVTYDGKNTIITLNVVLNDNTTNLNLYSDGEGTIVDPSTTTSGAGTNP